MVHLLFLFRLLQLLVVSLSWFSCAATPRNVLLVVVDDLRPGMKVAWGLDCTCCF